MIRSVKPTQKPRYKFYGVEVTRPCGRVRLDIPVKNWTDEHAAIMREVERSLVKLFAVKSLRGASPQEPGKPPEGT